MDKKIQEKKHSNQSSYSFLVLLYGVSLIIRNILGLVKDFLYLHDTHTGTVDYGPYLWDQLIYRIGTWTLVFLIVFLSSSSR